MFLTRFNLSWDTKAHCSFCCSAATSSSSSSLSCRIHQFLYQFQCFSSVYFCDFLHVIFFYLSLVFKQTIITYEGLYNGVMMLQKNTEWHIWEMGICLIRSVMMNVDCDVMMCVCVQRGNTRPAHTVCQRSWLRPAVHMCVRLNKRSRWSPQIIRRESQSRCTTSRFRPSTSRATSYSVNVREWANTQTNTLMCKPPERFTLTADAVLMFLLLQSVREMGEWVHVRSHLLLSGSSCGF